MKEAYFIVLSGVAVKTTPFLSMIAWISSTANPFALDT